MTKMIAPQLEWSTLMRDLRTAASEAFRGDGDPLNLIMGEWGHPGNAKRYSTPIDGRELGRLPMLDLETAKKGVRFAESEVAEWAKTDLAERKARVTACLHELKAHRDLIASLLMWEIGKTWKLACSDVDRCVSGVEWYIDAIDEMIEGREPLGLISNIASWNYPYSVLMHAALVQVLSGNVVIAKTPTDGGAFALTLGFALARRAGLPVHLVSGSGGTLSDALVRNPAVSALAFVGGKSTGRDIAASLYDRNKRYMLEMEGINSYGVWDFSDWDGLAKQIKSGFKYGKQRCTAYARFVVQRHLFPQFLAMYLDTVRKVTIGNPVLVENPGDELPDYDFGPLINSRKVEELRVLHSAALATGAVSLHEARLDMNNFMPGQDISAYIAPVAVLNMPRNAQLYHGEPFGPVDTMVVVDTIEELIAEMNVSNGCLVSSIATDDTSVARRVSSELRSFKVGVNKMRSRGDRDEVFGGIGASWKGCFVGGSLLVESVTRGPEGERLKGNFPDYTVLPEER